MSPAHTARRAGAFTARFFNPGIYLEGLMRLWVPGLAIGIPLAVVSVLIALTQEDITLLPILPTLLAPVLFLSAFSFLRDRRKADLFFSYPVSRTCLYLSVALAALTVYLLLAVVGLLCTVLPGIGRDIIVFRVPEEARAAMLNTSFEGCLRIFLYCLCCGFLLCGVMTVAAVLSGSVGHSLLLYALLALTPTVLRALPEAYVKLLPMSGWERMLTPAVPKLPLEVLSDVSILRSGSAAPYYGAALLVGVLCFVVGLLLFRGRKAETAGAPAAGRGVLCLTVCLLTLTGTIVMLLDEDTPLWPAAATAALYCVYLLLSTRRAASLWRFLPCAAAAVIVTVGVCHGGVRLAEEIILRTPLDADKVTGVSCVDATIPVPDGGFRFKDTNTFGRLYSRPNEYRQIRDPAVIAKLVEFYNKDRESRLAQGDGYTTGLKGPREEIVVAFYGKNGRCHACRIYVGTDDLTAFGAAFGEASEQLYRELLITLPPEDGWSLDIGFRAVDEKGQKSVQHSDFHIYNTMEGARVEGVFRREFEALDAQTRQKLVLSVDPASNPAYLYEHEYLLPEGEPGMREMYLRIASEEGISGVRFFVVDPDILPETYRTVCEVVPEAVSFMKGLTTKVYTHPATFVRTAAGYHPDDKTKH